MRANTSVASGPNRPDVEPLARLIADPLLIVDASGAVIEMNSQAGALTGLAVPVAPGGAFDRDDRFAALLADASGTSSYVVGALNVHTATGEARRFACHAVALDRSDRPRFAIHLLQAKESQFLALTEQLQEQNREIRLRRAAQGQLEQALAINETLYRELQHRVKNHLQMMLGLLSAAGRESADPSHRALIGQLQAQLSAIVEAQRLMYAAEDPEGVSGDLMLRSLADVIPRAAGSNIRIDCFTEPLRISNDMAFPLALIVNELLVNAIKHGATAPNPRIEMRLTCSGTEARLQISDNGPGLPPPGLERRSSGLGLVRGLCRQIGGRLELGASPGASVTVTFPSKAS